MDTTYMDHLYCRVHLYFTYSNRHHNRIDPKHYSVQLRISKSQRDDSPNSRYVIEQHD